MSKVTVVSTSIEPRLRLTLVADEDVSAGDVIFLCRPDEIIGERTWRTIQIDYNRHVKNDLLDYVEHSCEPNAIFVIDNLTLVALRSIRAGEPITFFYPGAEVELAQDFQCTCGSPVCLGHLKGGFYLTAEQMHRAIDSGYCTSFMKLHFERLLQLQRHV